MVTGGPGADRLRGSVWDTVFCYTKGDGPDHYTVYGFWNSFLLMGYGNSKVTIEETYSEDLETVSVLINGTDRIEIDISHLDHGYISFYQHDPVTKEPIPVHSIIFLKLIHQNQRLEQTKLHINLE